MFDLGRGQTIGLEFKAASVVDKADARHLITMRDDLGDRFIAGAVLHSGPGMFELGDRVYAIPLCAIWSQPRIA